MSYKIGYYNIYQKSIGVENRGDSRFKFKAIKI